MDLASFENVKAIAKRGMYIRDPSENWGVVDVVVEKELDRLDIVIENAGVATQNYRSTKDGWEETYLPSSLTYVRLCG